MKKIKRKFNLTEINAKSKFKKHMFIFRVRTRFLRELIDFFTKSHTIFAHRAIICANISII
jgi:hypothetical protein